MEPQVYFYSHFTACASVFLLCKNQCFSYAKISTLLIDFLLLLLQISPSLLPLKNYKIVYFVFLFWHQQHAYSKIIVKKH